MHAHIRNKLPASFYIGHVRALISKSARMSAETVFGQGIPVGRRFRLLTSSVERNRIPCHSLVLDMLCD